MNSFIQNNAAIYCFYAVNQPNHNIENINIIPLRHKSFFMSLMISEVFHRKKKNVICVHRKRSPFIWYLFRCCGVRIFGNSCRSITTRDIIVFFSIHVKDRITADMRASICLVNRFQIENLVRALKVQVGWYFEKYFHTHTQPFYQTKTIIIFICTYLFHRYILRTLYLKYTICSTFNSLVFFSENRKTILFIKL